jgi:hypothetical protein
MWRNIVAIHSVLTKKTMWRNIVAIHSVLNKKITKLNT